MQFWFENLFSYLKTLNEDQNGHLTFLSFNRISDSLVVWPMIVHMNVPKWYSKYALLVRSCLLSQQFVYVSSWFKCSHFNWVLKRQQQQFLKSCCLKWLYRQKFLIFVDESNETYLNEVNKLHLSLIDSCTNKAGRIW